MNRYAIIGKRVLKGDTWHDDNGPIPDTPLEWDPSNDHFENHLGSGLRRSDVDDSAVSK